MKQTSVITILILLLFNCSTKKTNNFVILEYNLENNIDSIKFNSWLVQNKLNNPIQSEYFYEDAEYLVEGYCMGEFGGELYFYDKLDTNFIYYLSCTCPLFVEKINNSFFITKTLAHLDGSTSILEIKDPKNLIKVRKDSLQSNWKEIRFPNLNEYQRYQFLECQNNCIIDTTGVLANIFFKRKNKEYLIYNNIQGTFLGELKNEKIKFIDTISNIPSYQNFIKNEKIDNIYIYSWNLLLKNNSQKKVKFYLNVTFFLFYIKSKITKQPMLHHNLVHLQSLQLARCK